MSLLLLKANIKNIGPLNDIELTLAKPGVYYITGKNNAGKTYALRALDYLLRAFPRGEENPLQNGAKEGEIIAFLGDTNDGLCLLNGDDKKYKYKLSRKFTPSRPGPISVEYTGIGELKQPRRVLDQFLCDMKNLDPWTFIQLPDKEQVDTLLKIVVIPLNKDHLLEIAGLDGQGDMIWPENPLDCIDGVYQKLYMARTKINQYLDIARKTLKGILVPEGRENAQHISFEVLLNEKKALENQERANQAEKDKLTKMRVDEKETMNAFNNAVQASTQQIEAIERQIKDLEAEKVQAQQEAFYMREEIKNTTGRLNADMYEQIKVVEALQPVDYTEINEKMADVDGNNKAAALIEDQKEQAQEVSKLTKEGLRFTQRLGEIQYYKRQILSETKFPMPGLSFKDGKVMLGDVPFKCQGQADQLIAAFEILRAQDPTLKVVLSFSETQMDSEHDKLLESLAIKYGFQFLCCQVAEEASDGRFFIEEGIIK